MKDLLGVSVLRAVALSVLLLAFAGYAEATTLFSGDTGSPGIPSDSDILAPGPIGRRGTSSRPHPAA